MNRSPRAVRPGDAQQSLHAAHARLAAIVESSSDAIIGNLPDGTVTDWNAAAEKLFGFTAGEMIGASIRMIVPPGHLEAFVERFERLRRGERIDPFETVRRRKDGTLLDVSVSVSPVRNATGGIVAFSTVARDITEAKRGIEALIESRTALRALATRLRNMREAERAHLAREIHDGLGQAFTALSMDLTSLCSMPEMPPPAMRKLAGMRRVIDDAIDSVRTMATELRPSVLDHFGLAAAIEEEVRQFRDRAKITCVLDLPRELVAIRGRQAIDVFRILQEALTNVARHAEASTVSVRLRVHDGSMELAVVDDGQGMRPAARARAPALGLLGMSERAIAWGGDISIDDVEPHGTRVTARIPVNDAS